MSSASSTSPRSSNASLIGIDGLAKQSIITSQHSEIVKDVQKEVDQVCYNQGPTIQQRQHQEKALRSTICDISSIHLGILGMNVVGISSTDTKWPIFLVIGLPLATVTVALPLTFEQFYRFIPRFTMHYPTESRWAMIMVGSFFALASVAVVVTVVLVTKKS